MSYILPADPTAIETAVATNADAITANSTTLSTHGTRLNATEAATTTNTADIATNTANITTNDSEIAALQSTVSGHTTSIGTNTSNISTNATSISTNTSNISTNTSGISAINAAKGAADGFCPLDGSSKVPEVNIPSVVSNLTVKNALELRNVGSTNTDFELVPLLTNAYPRLLYVFSQGDADKQMSFAMGASGNSTTKTGFFPGAYTLGTNYTEVSLGSNVNASEAWDHIYLNNAPTIVSDRKTKMNIAKERRGMSFLKKLKPRTWKRKIGQGKGKVHHGLVAQELMEVLTAEEQEEFLAPPETPDGVWGIRYGELWGPIIQTVQELAADNEGIKARLDALEKKKK